ncbi:MAG: YitT family protein [Clostridia bacterium]|nr:YitT family protein [Clostridia bacterium]
MKNKIKETFLDIIYCGGGCILYSAAVRIFAESNDIAQGGVTGVAMLVNFLFPKIPIGVGVFLLNLPLFLIAWKKIGGKFIVKSFFVTVFLSFVIDSISFLPTYTGDKMLASIFCGVLSGISMALVFIRGLTTGGTDILAKLIRLRKPSFSMGRLILICDFFVITLSGFVYGKIESALYSLVLIFVSSYVIDKILFGLTDSRTLLIVTEKHEEISAVIMNEMGRGVSVVEAEGGYTGKDKKILLSAMLRGEVKRVTEIIAEYDKNAFTIILPSSEIVGEGFENRK